MCMPDISYHIGFSLGTKTLQNIRDRDNRMVTISNQEVSMTDLYWIYINIFRYFTKEMSNGVPISQDYEVTWNGSEESGTRIMIRNLFAGAGNPTIELTLFVRPVRSPRPGGCWTQQVEDLIMETVKDSIVSPRNRHDNKCLLYCVLMGLMMKIHPQGGAQIFGRQIMVEESEICTKAEIYFQDQDDEVAKELRRLVRYSYPQPVYTRNKITGEPKVDPVWQMIQNLDEKATTLLSLQKFQSEFAEVEKALLPNEKMCGIDVYGMDFNVSIHLYPLYISKRRKKLFELLCITPKQSKCSHYCLVVNHEKLLQRSGGKQFVSCTKCGECFYHKRMLQDHHCPMATLPVNTGQLPIEGGYHFSWSAANANADIIYGYCNKCRLAFVDEFEYDYHMRHCLMKGFTGYRHVQLLEYGPNASPTLTGVEIDLEEENSHEQNRRILYADFESSIDPETGSHTFMSYGIYEEKTGIYETGFDLQDFFDYILEVAYNNPEKHVYVYFHNAMGYDANFVLRHVLKNHDYDKWGIQVIMKSSNKLQKLVFYTKIADEETTRIIHICDTFMFMTLSLESIVDSIRTDNLEMNKENFESFFEIFHKRYPDVKDEDIDHILRKNIFPYKFFTDSSKLDTPIKEFLEIFKPKNENLQFFSERVTVDDLYKNFPDVQNVVNIFNITSARDYHDLYLCCDVMQLSDIFHRAMNILWESHHIHLPRYLGMPSASWAAFLRFTPKMSIPLYTKTFYAEFFKNMIRGGITSAPLRYAKADERHSIIYLDVNGLYPYVMQAYPFPCGEFGFVKYDYDGKDECKQKLFELFEKFERTKTGVCFCVDIHFPDAVKEMTDMYPFAPEHRKIYSEYFVDPEQTEMKPFLKKWSAANNGETMKEFLGLVCTLYDKKEYNVHWRLLKFYLEHGVEITHVYYGVSFKEDMYLAPYIRYNIEIRNKRKDALGKTLYKLIGNSIYGKSYESPMKRNTYEIVRDPIKIQGLLEEGRIACMTPIDDLGWIVKFDGDDIILDKPTYIGACVCEFSKLHMYTLLYDKLATMFPSTPEEKGCELVYTDTDSFIVRVRHPDGVGKDPHELFAYMRSKDPDLLGGIGGQVKSETGEDSTISEIIALRSKVYCYLTTDGHEGKRAKGTTHSAQEMQLDWNTYMQVLQDLTSFDTLNPMISKSNFAVFSENVTRRSLSCNDSKRDISNDGIHTHAWGYFVRENRATINYDLQQKLGFFFPT